MKTERLGLRLSSDTKAILQQLAAADGRSVNNFVERLIIDAYEKQKDVKNEGSKK